MQMNAIQATASGADPLVVAAEAPRAGLEAVAGLIRRMIGRANAMFRPMTAIEVATR